MVDLTSLFDADKTLKACDNALVAAQFDEKPRPYLGASSIGEACSRKLWYRLRWVRELFDAAALKRIALEKNSRVHRGKRALDPVSSIEKLKIRWNWIHKAYGGLLSHRLQ